MFSRNANPLASHVEALFFRWRGALWGALLAAGLLLACSQGGNPSRLRLATTTSTADSGLLDVLLTPFENEHNIKVEVIAVGTGQALALGERGDADLLLVHDPAREERFMASGNGRERAAVMHNDFVILGSTSDVAGIRGLTSATEAFRRIAVSRSLFISRGDESGTHAKEREIWSAAGVVPAGDWYLSTGQGMAATLQMASEKVAYSLSDRGTYLALRES